MNYRHAYHAGAVADVFKHLVLIGLLTRLRQKESAFFVLDTHAGTGLYDLNGIEAQKTGEFRAGIGTLFGSSPESPLLAEYLGKIAALNSGELAWYPGSPLLIAGMLRPQDRAAFCELHARDVHDLRRAVRGFANTAVHHRDGYEALGAFLPPREKRGLVLVDPPFETATELEDAAKGLRDAWTRFPQGTLALWHPIKERPALWRFHKRMIATGIRKQLVIEFLTGDEGDSRVLNGSGMLLVNPPYRLEEELRPALEELKAWLAPETGRIVFQTLVGE